MQLPFRTICIATVSIVTVFVWTRRTSKSRNQKKRIRQVLIYPGLLNIGNSCYMNSVLQLLASSVEFRTFLDRLHSNISRACRKLISQLNASSLKIIDPREFLYDAFGASFPTEQQDAHEFLLVLIGQLSKSHHVIQPSLFGAVFCMDRLSPFEGIYICVIDCKNCQNRSSLKLNVFSVLSLDCADTVEMALRHWSDPEMLEGYRCNRCNLVDHSLKANHIIRHPQIFIIHLNRIRMTMTGQLYKDDRMIKSQCLPNYHLKAAVEHSGSISHGHYVAFRRISQTSWQKISDSESEIYNRVTQRPYLLLYERK